MSIRSAIEAIGEELGAYFRKFSYYWKTAETFAEFHPDRPHIYLFNCPKDDRNDLNFPKKTPSITIVVDGAEIVSNDTTSLTISMHCVAVNPAIIEREMSTEEDGIHTYGTGDGYTSDGAASSLYRDTLLLGEIAMEGVFDMSHRDKKIYDVRLYPPRSDISDYPYCQCTVTFKCDIQNKYSPSLGEYL